MACVYLGYHEARLVLSVPVPVHVAQLLAGRNEGRRQWRPKKEYFTNILEIGKTLFHFQIRMFSGLPIQIRNYLYGYGSGTSMNSKQN